jgi:hypothetical protein
MKIPEKFTMGPHTFKVCIKPNMWKKSSKVGVMDFGNQRLDLQPPMKGRFNKRCCYQAYLHEICHGLLFYSGERELYCKEELVDCMANLLMQVLETSEGDALK